MRRGVTFFAALALLQNKPQVALEVISNVKQQSYLTIRTIKALALSNLKRYDDVLSILRSVLVDNPMLTKQTFPSGVIEQLKKEFAGNTVEDLQADFNKVIGFLEKHGHISQNTLDDILCVEIQQTAQSNNRGFENERSQPNRDDYGRRDNRGFQPRSRELDYPSGRIRRPGLHELN